MTDAAAASPTPEQLAEAWRAAFTDITELPTLADGASCLWARLAGIDGAVIVQCYAKVGDVTARYSQTFAEDGPAGYNEALAQAFVIGAMKAYLAEHGVNP